MPSSGWRGWIGPLIVTVIADTRAPSVQVMLSTNQINLDGEVRVTVFASDNVGVASVSLTADGVAVPLDSKNSAVFPASLAGRVTFAATAFSLPMIADRDVDMVTAVVSSINAVLRNKRVALLWALLILAITVAGFATLFIGLGVLMPWLAYSAWHAYRETLDASGWPPLAVNPAPTDRSRA